MGERLSEGVLSSREKILDTAEALFARCGFSGVGLREVADRVGLGKSSLFHHFPTKVDLYTAVLERALLSIEKRLQTAQAPEASSPEQLDLWLSALVDVLAENPTYAPLLLRTLFEAATLGHEERAPLDRILGNVTALLEHGIAAGELRPVSVPHALQSLIGLTIYPFASGAFGDDLLGQPAYSAGEIRRRKEEISALLRHGLRAPRA
jgi:TetR/AcrR family transcriptional repressor of nem operon